MSVVGLGAILINWEAGFGVILHALYYQEKHSTLGTVSINISSLIKSEKVNVLKES